jgi:hypothetical protein
VAEGFAGEAADLGVSAEFGEGAFFDHLNVVAGEDAVCEAVVPEQKGNFFELEHRAGSRYDT